ncbi:MAG: AbgT family transporter, partial [Caldilineaceae bacterium]
QVAPRRLLTFIIVLTGIMSSVATDAGYLILVPLAAAAFLQVKRNPIAGLAAGFAAVGGIFAVNILITPLDGMLTEVTNEAIGLITNNPPAALSVTANFFFNSAFTLIMAVVVTIITERIVEPRLGAYDPSQASGETEEASAADNMSPAAEAKGLRGALIYFLVAAAVIALLTLIPGAPLNGRDGGSPFLDSIIFIISLLFLFAGIGFGRGAGTLTTSNQVIAAATKTSAGLGGLLLLFLIISQFIAHFNFTGMPQLLAVWLAELLGRTNIGAVPLLIGFILVIMVLDIIIPNSIPKWAIFAPIFVPLFVNLGVEPQTVLAAYRVGDSPLNVVTPLMVYLPFTVLVLQRYQKSAGIGSLISLMLPYVVIVTIVWIVLFVLWYV